MILDIAKPELLALKGKTILLATWGLTPDGYPFIAITDTKGDQYILTSYGARKDASTQPDNSQ